MGEAMKPVAGECCFRAQLSPARKRKNLRLASRWGTGVLAGLELRCAALLMLSMARRVCAAQTEKLRNRGKGSLVAVQAAHRQEHEEQLGQVRRPKTKTRGAKLQKAANAAIDGHASLQLSQTKGKYRKEKQERTHMALVVCRLDGTAHPSRDARTSHFCKRSAEQRR
jgi:hypothetical protein